MVPLKAPQVEEEQEEKQERLLMLKRSVPGRFFRVGGHFHIIRRTKGVLGEKDVLFCFFLNFTLMTGLQRTPNVNYIRGLELLLPG